MESVYVSDIEKFRPELGMSLREYAAIHLRLPRSGNPALDEMINQSICGEVGRLNGLCPAERCGKDPVPLPYSGKHEPGAVIHVGEGQTVADVLWNKQPVAEPVQPARLAEEAKAEAEVWRQQGKRRH